MRLISAQLPWWIHRISLQNHCRESDGQGRPAEGFEWVVGLVRRSLRSGIRIPGCHGWLPSKQTRTHIHIHTQAEQFYCHHLYIKWGIATRFLYPSPTTYVNILWWYNKGTVFKEHLFKQFDLYMLVQNDFIFIFYVNVSLKP